MTSAMSCLDQNSFCPNGSPPAGPIIPGPHAKSFPLLATSFPTPSFIFLQCLRVLSIFAFSLRRLSLRDKEAKGVDGVSFKHWEKGGLSVDNSHCGTCLVGLMISVEHALVTHPKAPKWEKGAELNQGHFVHRGAEFRVCRMNQGAW
jgi:hypothetical protein